MSRTEPFSLSFTIPGTISLNDKGEPVHGTLFTLRSKEHQFFRYGNGIDPHLFLDCREEDQKWRFYLHPNLHSVWVDTAERAFRMFYEIDLELLLRERKLKGSRGPIVVTEEMAEEHMNITRAMLKRPENG